ncbi:MAG: RNA polymerase sigma factor [Saprospiraceae bacterium]|nr:RNA polymerase sigma factor [Saprospiraceae bacterium]
MIFKKQSYNEEELVKACAQNDRRAQEVFYRTYFPAMWAMTIRYMQDEDKAMEVLNLGFLKVFLNLERYEFKGSLEGWIRRIIYNTMIDFVRKNNKYVRFMVFEDHDIAASETGPSNLYEEDLLKEVDKLPPATKEVFVLYAIEGYTHKEIADKTSMSEGTSKWHLSHARQLLKASIKLKENEYVSHQKIK